MALNPKRAAFVMEYLVDLNGTQAAIRAGYSAKTAYSIANQLLNDPTVKEAVQAAMAKRAERVHATADDVLTRVSAWLMADPRELVQLRRVCCRFCYGDNHEYQETPAEARQRRRQYDDLLKQVLKATMAGKPVMQLPDFDELGGVGYDPRKPAVEDCPECFGEGELKEYLADTSTLSPGAAMLFGGFKSTQHGIEVKLQSKEKAADLLARHHGLLERKGDDESGEGRIYVDNNPDADLEDGSVDVGADG